MYLSVQYDVFIPDVSYIYKNTFQKAFTDPTNISRYIYLQILHR